MSVAPNDYAHGRQTSLLGSIPEEAQLTLRFQGICAYVNTCYESPSLVKRFRRAVDDKERKQAELAEQKQILHDVSGVMHPGEVLALMGPSGSGKTSLLSVISGRAPRAVRTTGRVTVNGTHFTKAQKRRVGFVLQDDLLYETLTVLETLNYAAALRLPRGMSAAVRRERVDAVIDALGLRKCKDTIIGGFFRRGISGGERKRVSIGHELLINPAILMLDEPTSGLDSTTALHLLITLRELATGGRAIATTIHQPSSRLYQQLDALMLLSEGHVCYYGKAQEVVPWFSALGFAMPYGVNVADFLLDLAQGEVVGGSALGPSHRSSSNTPVIVEEGEQQQQLGQAGVYEEKVQELAQGGGGVAILAQPSRGPGPLSGAAAVRALYSSYELFQQKHKQGFQQPGDLDDLVLALDPPTPKRRKQGLAGELGGSPGGLMGSFKGSFKRAGSWLKGSPSTTEVGAADVKGMGDDDDDEEDMEVGRDISRAFSRSASHSALSMPLGPPTGGAFLVDGGKPGAGGPPQGLVARTVRRLGVADRGGAGYLTQLQVLMMRNMKVRRFESLSGQRFFQLVAVAVITGLFWWQRGAGNTLLAAQDVTGLLFFELLFPAFACLFSALFTFPNEFRMLLKERASGMYRVSAFYLASAGSDLPMDCAYPVLFVVVVYLMGGLRMTAAAFFSNVAATVLLVLTAQGVGLLLGAAFMNPKNAQTVATITMLSFMLVGGYYVRGIPVWIDWVKYISFIYWGFNLLLKIEFSGTQYYSCGDVLSGKSAAEQQMAASGGTGARVDESVEGCRPVPDLQAAMQLPVDVNAPAWPDVLVLLAMLLVLRVAVYIVLRKKTKAA